MHVRTQAAVLHMGRHEEEQDVSVEWCCFDDMLMCSHGSSPRLKSRRLLSHTSEGRETEQEPVADVLIRCGLSY